MSYAMFSRLPMSSLNFFVLRRFQRFVLHPHKHRVRIGFRIPVANSHDFPLVPVFFKLFDAFPQCFPASFQKPPGNRPDTLVDELLNTAGARMVSRQNIETLKREQDIQAEQYEPKPVTREYISNPAAPWQGGQIPAEKGLSVRPRGASAQFAYTIVPK
jgi:hypothetical protein